MDMGKPRLELLLPLALAASWPAIAQVEPPAIALADKYHRAFSPVRYLVSEKLDGARAFWDGSRLISRSGRIYHAPEWFTAGLPSDPLDGELWTGRGEFERLMRIIRDAEPDPEAWRAVGYHVFDLPASKEQVRQRQARLAAIVDAANLPQLHYVEQRAIGDRAALQQALDEVVAAGGEGLMLQHVEAHYEVGRHNGLLKFTAHDDAEATVVGYTPGRGKYQGMIGALVVERPDGLRFKLGSGLSDALRLSPPALGETITYRYRGETRRGVPRFARFLRVRLHD